MSDDLVKRLRDPDFGTETTERKLMDKAADRIEELEKQNASLEAKLAVAVKGLKSICMQPEYRLPSPQEIASATLAEIKGEQP